MTRTPRPVIYIPLILLSLLTLIFAPRIVVGFRDESRAQKSLAAGQYARAAESYEAAARRLFWRNDLWEQAGLAAQNDPAEALRLLDEAQSRQPLSLEGLMAFGDAHYALGDQDTALSYWQAALSAGYSSAGLYERLAGAYYILGDKDAEIEALRGWLVYHADNAAAHYRLGLLLIVQSPDEAFAELETAARVDEGYASVFQTLRTALNLALLEPAPAEKLVIIGRALGLASEWELAADAFRRAAQADPESASAWAWLGEAKQHLGQNPLPDLDKALNLQPDSTLIRSLRGLYWQRQEKAEEALLEFQTAAGLEPENPVWHSALGEVYAQAGDLPPALAAYQQAVELAPETPLYWRLLAVFCLHYSVQVEEVGLPAAQKAVILAPNDPVMADTLGWVYLTLGQMEDAEKQLLHALEIAPDFASAHLHLGMLYLQGGQRELAYGYLLKARDLAGSDVIGQQAQRILEQYFP